MSQRTSSSKGDKVEELNKKLANSKINSSNQNNAAVNKKLTKNIPFKKSSRPGAKPKISNGAPNGEGSKKPSPSLNTKKPTSKTDKSKVPGPALLKPAAKGPAMRTAAPRQPEQQRQTPTPLPRTTHTPHPSSHGKPKPKPHPRGKITNNGRGGHLSGPKHRPNGKSKGSHEKSSSRSSGKGPSSRTVYDGPSPPPPPPPEVIENIDPSMSRSRKIEEMINATTGEPPMKFESIPEYFQHISYSLFLEELFENEIFSNVTIEWSRNEPQTKLTAIFNFKEIMDTLVNDKMKHLKKSPFTMGQAIILLRKSDSHLDTKPEIWCCSVEYSTTSKKGRPQKLQVSLSVNNWNATPIPAGSSPTGFAILPCGAVVSRVMQSMIKLENPNFKDLLLGQNPIKQIFFRNYIGSYKNQLNDSQKVALQSALNNSITVLKGPPGSGKTSTIYEMILQLLNQLSYYPILVVAASNIAVDNIAEKLMKDNKSDIIRIVSTTKESEYGFDHPLADICLHNKIANMLSPSLRETYDLLKAGRQDRIKPNEFRKFLDTSRAYSEQLVAQAKVIFSTTVAIGGPYLKKVANLPVIIMDEATQTSEPGSLIPLAANGVKKIIFVGDEAQLSAFTRVKSLEMSLFERTLKNGSYQKPFMFDTQYRMHPEISEFPRNYFYGGLLKDGVTAEDRQVPGIKYPVYFWDHMGKNNTRESRVLSKGANEEMGYTFVNRNEVGLIARLVETLIVDKQISPDRIGIITAYAGQRDLISENLQSNLIINPSRDEIRVSIDKEDIEDNSKAITVHQINGILIATIDAFQGREKDFIIMSCVRSNDVGNIGFIKDRRRMNVALTRARCSLIFTGNASCLKKGDQLWDQYITSLEAKGYVVQGELTY